MTDLRAAAQQALEALTIYSDAQCSPKGRNAITALRTALEQPEQPAEPCIGKDPQCPCQDGYACHYKDCGSTKALPVPVAQRPWQGLTPEDLAQIDTDEFWQVGNHMAIAMAVEDKLKERNT